MTEDKNNFMDLHLKYEGFVTYWGEFILDDCILDKTLYLGLKFYQLYGENPKKIPTGHELNQVVK